ncbi:MAG: hypothetical protein KJ970_04725 [Candidatus Eisenbacteria bacterium]|uniref:Uncharacterized protein n=1 Tax=Eiseniibacteriota bacterium TaxID=2212470 RepID=A0A948RUH2_UNCEI|nr:hypothetical protein [Candidatus Eisenbacteria bacterium]MBU1948712.1 hypothetical protein [Candidatus Eisenbacteria bacterium]MBU2690211.1 hypothetical protein [Candidatus Eisenbacteria bacterium]
MHDKRHIERLRKLVIGWEAGDETPQELHDCMECRREWEDWRRLFELMEMDRRAADTPVVDFRSQIFKKMRGMREAGQKSKRHAGAVHPIPSWQGWLEGLVRAPLAYGALGGLILGAWVGSMTLRPEDSGMEVDDLLFTNASAWNTPTESMSEDYFENLLDPADDGGELP